MNYSAKKFLFDINIYSKQFFRILENSNMFTRPSKT